MPTKQQIMPTMQPQNTRDTTAHEPETRQSHARYSVQTGAGTI